ncbi:ankyrin repeat-containing protein At5g02620 [Amaranthus tricolor]|uniref:ankyrin repeat-containing protein At5g02620 n=1 Tax=Amaranthus tricolor TaxID=29722 RepID=UPI002590363D|nr:ankyrin repeat-containing protein At5g02620 [Amaranthus tricolor]XP_057546832.1 ankyrin repeat-containing protein At5g02620 [Amaranthus tricolor]
MEKSGGKTMEKQSSFRKVMEKQVSFKNVVDKPESSGKTMEKLGSFRGAVLEKQKSFQLKMERQFSFAGSEKKKSKDSPGKRGDSPLHMYARAGNLRKIIEIIQNCESDDCKTLLCKQNQEGETPLYVAAENGHAMVVGEFMKYLDLHTASIGARSGYDPFHIAARQGHIEVLKELLRAFPNLAMTTDPSNTTALHTAATQGNIDVVNLLLETDSNLAKIARNNGKTVLHSAARMGHLEVVKALLEKDPSIGFRTDRKGQTALHMAVKGQNQDIVIELLRPDPSILSLEDNKGNTALHIATKKGRAQNVSCLLQFDGIGINAINKAGESVLDIAEKVGPPELVSVLREAGALTSKELGKPPSTEKQLKQTVSDIKHNVKSQLQQTHQTDVRVQKIAKKLKKLHTNGLNNAINNATVVAVLIATVAFAAIFQVPGQYVEQKTPGKSLGQAQIADNKAFTIFFVFDSAALFISLAVVVVQTSVVVIEQKAKKQLMFVINKLMWVACLCISVAFIALSYVVVGPHGRWLAIWATVIGAVIMIPIIGSMFYCMIMHRLDESKSRRIKRAESKSHSYSMSAVASDPEFLSTEYKRMYVL